MPTRFLRGPPHDAWGRRTSAYSEGRHSVPYADVGIGYDVVIVRKLILAESACAVLGGDLSVHQLPHLRVRPDFPISTRVLRIINATNAHLARSSFLRDWLSSAAGERTVNWAQLILSESQGVPQEGFWILMWDWF
jgi:hypothetical protein